jgi:hypothetical protein
VLNGEENPQRLLILVASPWFFLFLFQISIAQATSLETRNHERSQSQTTAGQ